MLHDHPHDELDYSKPVLTRWIGDGIGLQAPVSHSTVTAQSQHSHSTVTSQSPHSHSTVTEGGSGITSDCKHQSAPDKHGHLSTGTSHCVEYIPRCVWGGIAL